MSVQLTGFCGSLELRETIEERKNCLHVAVTEIWVEGERERGREREGRREEEREGSREREGEGGRGRKT